MDASSSSTPAHPLPLAPLQVPILRQLSDPARDSLLILARGLGLHRLVISFLHAYCTSKTLVLVINATDYERSAYTAMLEELEPACPPKVVTAEMSVAERATQYMQGGKRC